MTRSKLGLMGLCAVIFGVMAMSASSAQASLFTWLYLKVEGGTATEVSGTEKIAVEGKIDSNDITLLTKEIGIKFAVTCTNFALTGVNLEKEGTLTPGGKVKFTGCEAYGKGSLEEALGCKVHSAGQPAGTVESLEGKGALLLHEIKAGETELVTKIEPKEGTVFATFLTEGCVLPESNPINGKLFLKDCQLMAELHLKEHLIEQGPLTSLWVGKDTAEHLETSIDGSAWVFLSNGLSWGGKHNLP